MADHQAENVIYLTDYIDFSDLKWMTASFFTSGMLLPHDVDKVREIIW